jgi:hypothetical protein
MYIIPVGNDTVFNGVLQSEDTSLGLGFVTDIGIFLAHTDHDTLVARATDNGGEDGTGGIVTGETGFAHTGTIIDNKSLNFVTGHCVVIRQMNYEVNLLCASRWQFQAMPYVT